MAQPSYRLRGDGSNQEIVCRLRREVEKLQNQLQRLQIEEAPHRFSLMKTYKTMIRFHLSRSAWLIFPDLDFLGFFNLLRVCLDSSANNKLWSLKDKFRMSGCFN